MFLHIKHVFVVKLCKKTFYKFIVFIICSNFELILWVILYYKV